MTLTKAKLDKIHPVYRDLMIAFKPVIESRSRPSPIRGLTASCLFDASARKYGYDPEQFYEIVENLRHQGLVDMDKFGYYFPTKQGGEFIQDLAKLLEIDPHPPSHVPPLDLGE